MEQLAFQWGQERHFIQVKIWTFHQIRSPWPFLNVCTRFLTLAACILLCDSFFTIFLWSRFCVHILYSKAAQDALNTSTSSTAWVFRSDADSTSTSWSPEDRTQNTLPRQRKMQFWMRHRTRHHVWVTIRSQIWNWTYRYNASLEKRVVYRPRRLDTFWKKTRFDPLGLHFGSKYQNRRTKKHNTTT